MHKNEIHHKKEQRDPKGITAQMKINDKYSQRGHALIPATHRVEGCYNLYSSSAPTAESI